MSGGLARQTPTVVAYAVTRTTDPVVLLAENDVILSRVLALKLVAATPSVQLPTDQIATIRSALLEERWADAVVDWMAATGIAIDAYPSERVWSSEELDEERTSLELRVAPIFEDTPGDAE